PAGLGRPAGAAGAEAAGRVRPAEAGARPGGVRGVAAAGGGGGAGLLERRRHLHAGPEGSLAVGAAAATLPGPDFLVGPGAAVPALPREGVGAVGPALDDLRRPDAAPAGIAPDAGR